MNSLLPNNNSRKETFDESKCFVTLEQIENMISEIEANHDRLIDEYDTMGETIRKGNVSFTKKAIADMIADCESQIRLLKDLRHMAYVNGGYRN